MPSHWQRIEQAKGQARSVGGAVANHAVHTSIGSLFHPFLVVVVVRFGLPSPTAQWPTHTPSRVRRPRFSAPPTPIIFSVSSSDSELCVVKLNFFAILGMPHLLCPIAFG